MDASKKGDVVWHQRKCCHGIIVHVDTMLLNGAEVYDCIFAVDHSCGEAGRDVSDLEPHQGQNLEGCHSY